MADPAGRFIRSLLTTDSGVARFLGSPQAAKMLPPDLFFRVQRGDPGAVQEAVQFVLRGQPRMDPSGAQAGDMLINDPEVVEAISQSGRYRLQGRPPENVLDATVDPGTGIIVTGNPATRQGVPVGMFGGPGRQLVPSGPSGPSGAGRVDDIFGSGDPTGLVPVTPQRGGPGVPVGGPAGGPRGIGPYTPNRRPGTFLRDAAAVGIAAAGGATAYNMLNPSEGAPAPQPAAQAAPPPAAKPPVKKVRAPQKAALAKKKRMIGPRQSKPGENTSDDFEWSVVEDIPDYSLKDAKVGDMDPEAAARLRRERMVNEYIDKYGKDLFK